MVLKCRQVGETNRFKKIAMIREQDVSIVSNGNQAPENYCKRRAFNVVVHIRAAMQKSFQKSTAYNTICSSVAAD